jgi:hypothetical protein
MATTFKAHENNAKGTLNTAINDSVLTIILDAGQGAEFPSSGAFWITLYVTDPDDGNEIVLCDSISTDTITVNASGRGDQGTTATSWAIGTIVEQLWTKEEITDLSGAINNIEDGTTTLDSVTTNGDVTVGDDGSGNIVAGTGNTTIGLLDTVATTINMGGAATTVDIGAATGTTTIKNDLVSDGSVTVGDMLNLGTATELTIATGVITATRSYHLVDTELDAASDDLDTINGGTEGDILVLRPANAARTVVLKDGADNLLLAGDFSLDANADVIVLLFIGGFWVELTRSNNAA